MQTNFYQTGTTSDGYPLLGGAWRMAHQEGFPLEMANMLAIQEGMRIDWLEAMADASIDNNLPALMKQVESFMPAEDILNLKRLYSQHVLDAKADPASIVAEKKLHRRDSAFQQHQAQTNVKPI